MFGYCVYRVSQTKSKIKNFKARKCPELSNLEKFYLKLFRDTLYWLHRTPEWPLQLYQLHKKTNFNALKLGILPRIYNNSLFAQFFRGNLRLICQVKSITLNPWLYNGMACLFPKKKESRSRHYILANASIARNNGILLKF